MFFCFSKFISWIYLLFFSPKMDYFKVPWVVKCETGWSSLLSASDLRLDRVFSDVPHNSLKAVVAEIVDVFKA